MAEFRSATPEQGSTFADLTGAGLLIPTGVPGVYGRGAAFEDIRGRFGALVERRGQADGAERIRFPPLVPRQQLEDIGYLKSFPHLAGTIFAFEGDEGEAVEQEERAARHEDWSEFQRMTDLVLSPAACYPVYPAIARRGPLPEGGVTVDAGAAYVFRREPSEDPGRLQMFHQREIVRLGEPDVVSDWRDSWRERALELVQDLGLDARIGVASDPFFGRSGRMLAANQRKQELKFEIAVEVAGPEPTAIASFNYHQDHFATVFDLRTTDGGRAHTACLGFGEERVTIALFRRARPRRRGLARARAGAPLGTDVIPRVGIDLVSVDSVRESLQSHGDRYLQRLYTAQEIEDCSEGGAVSAERLAARFAAKEATMKALRLPPSQGLDWRSIELVRNADGWLSLRLTGSAAQLAKREGMDAFSVSVTHEEGLAAAVVLAIPADEFRGATPT